MNQPTVDHRMLTDCIDIGTLQTLQDRLADLTGVAMSIRDPSGQPITTTSGESEFCRIMSTSADSCEACRLSHERASGFDGASLDSPVRLQCHAGLTQLAAPMTVTGRHIGSILMGDRPAAALTDEAVDGLAREFNLDAAPLRAAAGRLRVWSDDEVKPVFEFLSYLAHSLARRCYTEVELRDRIDELTVLYRLGEMLAGTRDVQEILDKSTKLAADVLQVKASGIRLLDEETGELRVASTYNLSRGYLEKGGVSLRNSPIDVEAMEQGVVFVRDFPNDPRSVYRDEARREGLVSVLVARMMYRGQTIGVIRVYAGRERVFSPFEWSLLQNMGSQMAAAIMHARLLRDSLEAERLERQIALAGAVQRRMIPAAPPRREEWAFGAVYVPSLTLSGDLYDFIELSDGRVGVVVADVVGKGVPASLTMASVRASLRSHARHIDDIAELMRRVNRDVCHDTPVREFVTAFYGVLDGRDQSLVYCNAGHDPPFLLREGQLRPLQAGGLILGIEPAADYASECITLRSGDALLLYTDGLVDGMNFDGETFGRARVQASLLSRSAMPAQEMASQMLWDQRRFRGLARQTDDITIVTIRVR